MMRNLAAVRSVLSMVVLLLVTAGCASVPQYDAVTDAAVTALQREVDGRLVALQSAAERIAAGSTAGVPDTDAQQILSYAANGAFYDTVEADLTALELRMEAVQDPSTANLPQHFQTIRTMLANLRQLHRAQNGLGARAIGITRLQMNAQFATLITYELALKGVAAPKQAATSSTATSRTSAAAAATNK